MSASGDKDKALANSRRWSGKTRGGVLGNWFFYILLRYLGLGCAYTILFPVVFYFLLFSPEAVRASNDYRRRIGYGSMSLLSRFCCTYKHFLSFGKMLLDRVVIIAPGSSRFKFVFEEEHQMRGALEEGKGLILISAHCGNWEGAAQLLSRLEVPVNIVAYEGEAEQIQKFLDKALKNRYFSVIAIDGRADSTLAIIAALNRNEIVAMHADRCIGEEGEILPFLGGYARFPTGPYTVAALSGAPLICTFAMREGLYSYHLYAYPAEHLTFTSRSQRRQLLKKWISSYIDRLESILRDYPLQWYNFYDFWEEDSSVLKS